MVDPATAYAAFQVGVACYEGAKAAQGAVDDRSKKYGHWILEHVWGKDPKKILNAHVVVNPRIDGFGLFGAGKFHTKCVGMDFATGFITLHG